MQSSRPKARRRARMSSLAAPVFLHSRGKGEALPPLGVRAEGLIRLAAAGVPVPAGFVIPADLCQRLWADAGEPAQRLQLLREHAAKLSPRRLLAIRCSAPAPLRGLPPAVLNLGMNDARLEEWTAAGHGRLAAESYARLILNYAVDVAGLPRTPFDAAVQQAASPEAIPQLVGVLRELYREMAGEDFPQDPAVQLDGAITAAVRARARARGHRTTAGPETGPAALAVIVQEMVLGNHDGRSGCGWGYTRDPASGEAGLRGEFLPEAQGPDLVTANLGEESLQQLARQDAAAWRNLLRAAEQLERACGDAQDFEFVLEAGQPWILRSRALRRSDTAAIRIAVEMASQTPRLLSRPQATARIAPRTIEALLHPRIVEQNAPPLTTGLPASPGAAAGRIAFSSPEAIERAERGQQVILVRHETQAEDVTAMSRCAAILTTSGGMTSHAAVVARGMGVPCVVSAVDIDIDEHAREIRIGDRVLVAADTITLDGATGRIFEGAVPIVPGSLSTHSETLLAWADQQRRLRVYANADLPADAATAREMGADGIGLCRTEHMFFTPERLLLMRRSVLALDQAAGRSPIEELIYPQRQDFIGLFEAMDGLPVTIRLLDPPLHEFLPRTKPDIMMLAHALEIEPEELQPRIERLRETNPMLGERGCRLSLMRPELLDAQVTAFIEAAAYAMHWGRRVRPRLLFPMVMDEGELAWLVSRTQATAHTVQWRLGSSVKYELGVMIETPRAALRAAAMAPLVSFFSFGTNDLTQLTCGISRDDSQSFLPTYLERGIFSSDPFAQLDEAGVGALMAHAVKEGRRANPALEIGICGEHAGNEATIAFCQRLGLDSLSCSPYRVPGARLAAAQAWQASRS